MSTAPTKPISKPVKPASRPPAPPSPGTQERKSRQMAISGGVQKGGQRIVLYGPGGVGKSTLAKLLGDVGLNPVFIDLEDGTRFMDVQRFDPSPETFEEVQAAIRLASSMSQFDAIVIDTMTKCEELVLDYMLRTVKHEKGHLVKSIEGYGFGKGYVHLYETFMLLLQDLDAAVRAGKHVVCICHDCTANVPNPAGEDWIRYEPRLQSPPSGKGSIRHRVKEWCDHLLYIGFDAYVDEGKAKGDGSRQIYPIELPTHWAKSRVLREPMVYEDGNPYLWHQLFGSEK